MRRAPLPPVRVAVPRAACAWSFIVAASVHLGHGSTSSPTTTSAPAAENSTTTFSDDTGGTTPEETTTTPEETTTDVEEATTSALSEAASTVASGGGTGLDVPSSAPTRAPTTSSTTTTTTTTTTTPIVIVAMRLGLELRLTSPAGVSLDVFATFLSFRDAVRGTFANLTSLPEEDLILNASGVVITSLSVDPGAVGPFTPRPGGSLIGPSASANAYIAVEYRLHIYDAGLAMAQWKATVTTSVDAVFIEQLTFAGWPSVGVLTLGMSGYVDRGGETNFAKGAHHWLAHDVPLAASLLVMALWPVCSGRFAV